MTILSEAIESLKRQIAERIADDASTPCLLSFERAQAVLIALAELEQEPMRLQCITCGTVYADGVPPQVHEQEPVAWRTFDGEGGYDYRTYEDNKDYAAKWAKRNPLYASWVEPLYTAPTPRKPVELTDEELLTIYTNHVNDEKWGYERALIAEYEAKQGEKK